MDQVEEVKSKLDIVDVVGQYVALKRGGRNMKGLCPFHGEKSPSFMVNPELQIYKCFGCQKGGDAISFIQDIEGLEFVDALKMLADRVGVKLNFKGDEKKSEKEEMVLIQELASDYYHYLLTKHEVGNDAREYLRSRKIGEKLIEEFKLGYALSSWDGLYKFLVVKKKKDPRLVEASGLIMESSKRKGQFYDRLRERVVFPLFDHRGRVVGFSGRIMPDSVDVDTSPKYINSPETLVYHKSEMLFGLTQAKRAIREKDRVVVVEGEVDMISSFAAGVGETVAIKGSALTEQQIDRLKRLTNNLILALDADVAGDAATKRGIQIAEDRGMNIKVVQIVGGKDPDEIARNNPNTWKKMIDKAVDVYAFFLDSSLAKNDPKSVEGKRRISAEMMPVLVKIGNKVIQAFYVRKLAEVMGVSEESVMKEMDRVGRDPGLLKREVVVVKRERNREELLMEEILAYVFVVNRVLGEKIAKKVLEMGLVGAEFKILEEWLKYPSRETLEFIKDLPEELKGVARDAYMKEVETDGNEEDLEVALSELVRLRVKLKLENLKERIKKAEEEDDFDTSLKLQSEFMALSRRLVA